MGDHIGVVLLAAKIAVGYPLTWADPAYYIKDCQIFSLNALPEIKSWTDSNLYLRYVRSDAKTGLSLA